MPQPQTYFPSWTSCSEPQNYHGAPYVNMGLVGATGIGVRIGMPRGNFVLLLVAGHAAHLPRRRPQRDRGHLSPRAARAGLRPNRCGQVLFRVRYGLQFQFTVLPFQPTQSISTVVHRRAERREHAHDFRTAPAALGALEADWTAFGGLVPTNVPFSDVADEVGLIVAQPGVAGLSLPTRSENAVAPDDVVLPRARRTISWCTVKSRAAACTTCSCCSGRCSCCWSQEPHYLRFFEINSPTTPIIQSRPENQWTIHPLLDGCLGEVPYPEPQPPPVVIV